MMRQFDDHPAPRFVSGRFAIERAPIPRSMCDALLGFFLRRLQDTGENVIVTLKISEEKVIYGVLDGVNNPTNSCGQWFSAIVLGLASG